METKIISDSFGDIGTAVFYRVDETTADRVLHLASRTELDSNFGKYDFLHDPERGVYNKEMNINYLTDESRGIVGYKLSDLEKIQKTLFPCSTVPKILDPDKTEFGYFSTALLSNQTFFLFSAESSEDKGGYWKLELYDEIVFSNNDEGGKEFIDYDLNKDKCTIKPAIEITFPSPPIGLDPFDPVYIKLMSERNHSKELWVLISSVDDVREVNLSLSLWNNDVCPNRNLDKYMIRNDELEISSSNINLDIVPSQNYTVDKLSGNLLTNKKITFTPFLDKKRQRIKSDTVFSSKVHYDIGDEIIFEGHVWESLVKNNRSKNPMISNNWVLREKLTDYFIPRITLISDPLFSGKINNGINRITVLDRNEPIIFDITESIGYKIKEENSLSILYRESDVPELVDGSQYVYFAEELSDGTLKKSITILDWGDRLEQIERLIFNFENVGSSVNLSARDENVRVLYENWKTYFNEPDFVAINIDGEELSVPMKYTPGDEIEIMFKPLREKMIEEITLLGDTREIKLNQLPSGEYYFSDIADYTEGEYVVKVKNREFSVNINADTTIFELSRVIQESISYGSSYSLEFYLLSEDVNFSKILIKDDRNPDDIIEITLENNIIGGIQLNHNSETDLYELVISDVNKDYIIDLIYETK